jgi:pimeloyl-ACP methyl ester carboxylesterase/DNA-binding SARP family transcriptional activator
MDMVQAELSIELRLMGPMTLIRDGIVATLPASKKTRALLAYLAVADRPVRRDRLCELLWELPDDPRGALRWSLSKLRGLVDSPGRNRLIADQETVSLDVTDIAIDWRDLRDVVRGDLSDVHIDILRRVAGRESAFLEGLELPRCDQFQAWNIAQREDVRRWRCAVLETLLQRDLGVEEALGCAREWSRLEPYDPKAQLALVALLEKSGRRAEGDHQREVRIQRLKDADIFVPPELRSATEDKARSIPAEAPVQHVHFCTASDGVGLAFSVVGEGMPLVKAANWLNHLEYDWDSPIWRHWINELTRGHSLIRYDERGNGLSDWIADDISFEAFIDDLASVVDAAGLDQFDLLGVSQGCSVSIAYAVRHPGRVRRLVLIGGYSAGWRKRGSPEEIERREAMATLTRGGWGQNNPAFRQMFTSLFFPDATQAEMDWFNELQRMTTSSQNAERLQNAFAEIDAREYLAKVTVPTLVLHAREDAVVPFAEGRALAAAIPGARFVALESRNHLLLEHEPAWARFVTCVREFLRE